MILAPDAVFEVFQLKFSNVFPRYVYLWWNVPWSSDTVDTLNLPSNGNGNVNINLSNEASKATSDALTLRSVASTFPFVEPGSANNNLSLNGGFSTYDPSTLVEDKWKTSSTGFSHSDNGVQNGSGQNGQTSFNNGNLKRYNDNDHYLR